MTGSDLSDEHALWFEPQESDYWVERASARKRRILARLAAALVVVALISGFAVLSSTSFGGTPAARPRQSTSPWHAGNDASPAVAGVVSDGTQPTPTAGAAQPLGHPPPLPLKAGKYAYLATQPHGVRPVTYDPCRPIHYVVNAEFPVPDSQRLLTEAIMRVSDATGLVFKYDGVTTEAPGDDRPAFQPERYGDRWAPVVIWWTTPEHAPRLAGNVAGFAGSVALERTEPSGASSSTYVTGTVVLDGPQFAGILARSPDGYEQARGGVLHELGHLVGLDHVDDPSQIMYPESTGAVTSYAAGDLRGLNELGRGTCNPTL